MRIGMVAGEYPPMQGGVGAYSRILAGELAQQGQTVFIFSSVAARNSDANIHLTNGLQHWGINALLSVRRWAHEHRLDVVNIQFQTAAYHMSPWIHFLPDMLRPIPVVTTFHDLRYPYLFPKAGRLRAWIVLHLARASAGVIVTNHEDQGRLRHLPHTCLIPIGSNIRKPLDIDFDCDHWRRKAGAAPADCLLAYFGLVNRSKGLDVLLRGLADLRGMGVPARLLIVGGTSGGNDPTNVAYAAEIQALIDQLRLAPYVHQTGYLDDESVVGAYLNASDAIVLPFLDGASYRRGSLMAAISYGCAIVTTQPAVDIPSFRNGENMLLAPPGDSAALTGALRQLRESPDLRQRLRQGALALAPAFDWGQIARDYVTFFQRIVEAARA
jgi:glycosyltransferase involved in cell wall biosynthesis